MSTPTLEQTIITAPGVYQLSDATYHGDPVPGGSLSVSGARLLLPPSCPARFAWQRVNGRAPKAAYNRGHAAHLLALGAGPELEIVDAPDWRTKAARQARDEAHAAGRVPLLAADYTDLVAMVAALREHPIAAELLDPDRMIPEQSVFWVDEESGIWRRARLDAVTRPDAQGPDEFIVDYKTTRSADLEHISRCMHTYGYAMQADWYLEGGWLAGATTAEARFLFVFQETEPPYLVSVVEPDAAALRIGRQLNRQAIDIYRQCTDAGYWPGHVPDGDIPLVSLPPWVERQHPTDDDETEIL